MGAYEKAARRGEFLNWIGRREKAEEGMLTKGYATNKKSLSVAYDADVKGTSAVYDRHTRNLRDFTLFKDAVKKEGDEKIQQLESEKARALNALEKAYENRAKETGQYFSERRDAVRGLVRSRAEEAAKEENLPSPRITDARFVQNYVTIASVTDYGKWVGSLMEELGKVGLSTSVGKMNRRGYTPIVIESGKTTLAEVFVHEGCVKYTKPEKWGVPEARKSTLIIPSSSDAKRNDPEFVATRQIVAGFLSDEPSKSLNASIVKKADEERAKAHEIEADALLKVFEKAAQKRGYNPFRKRFWKR